MLRMKAVISMIHFATARTFTVAVCVCVCVCVFGRWEGQGFWEGLRVFEGELLVSPPSHPLCWLLNCCPCPSHRLLWNWTKHFPIFLLILWLVGVSHFSTPIQTRHASWRGRIFLEGFEESSEEGKLNDGSSKCMLMLNCFWCSLGAWDSPNFLDLSTLGKSFTICHIRPWTWLPAWQF